MPTLPIIFATSEGNDFPAHLREAIQSSRHSELLLKYPTVYIHYWPGKDIEYIDKRGNEHKLPRYQVYVGESNDVIERTKQHYQDGLDKENWQYQLVNARITPQMIVIGHEHFNKSFTLDVENRLIEYIMSMDSVETLYNGRGNPQNSYYPVDEFENVFSSLWRKLTSIILLCFDQKPKLSTLLYLKHPR